MKFPIQSTITEEILKRIEERLKAIEDKVTSHPLERDEYILSLGQIEALRWCNEEVRSLNDKLL